ncbi:MAG: hypothetical protein JJU29_19695 [Verrucomicrobia bacterium]|nr:hypothetical protein [Verrucomicrobiota bacterium]MCH8510860.1 hypothetical protein [Kiritimatiellia bacterium]
MKTTFRVETITLALCAGVALSALHAESGPLTHVPSVEVKPQDLQENKPAGGGPLTHVQPPQIPPKTTIPIITPEEAAPLPGAQPREVLIPQPPEMSRPDDTRGPDHLLERGPDGTSPAADRMRETSVQNLFENAARVHPGELADIPDADALREMDGASGINPLEDNLLERPQGGLIPGQQRGSSPGMDFESQGFRGPDGMPASPVPSRTGRDAPRLVGPPSANLRDAGAGAAATGGGKPTIPAVTTITPRGSRTVYYEDGEDNPATGSYEISQDDDGTIIERHETPDDTGEKVLVVVVETPPDGGEAQSRSEVVPRNLDRLQDGDADPTGGSGVNPVTGLPTRPPKQNPDQVNPGPDGAVVLPSGARIRPRDLEVNPDPHQHRGGHDPAATLRRMESPDQVAPPPVGPAGAEAP